MSGKLQGLVWSIFLAALLCVFYFLSPVLMPFLIAAMLAYLFNPLVSLLEKTKLSRTWSVLCILFLITLLISLILLICIPLMQQQIINLVNKMPAMISWVEQTIFPWLNKHFGLSLSLEIDKFKAALPNSFNEATSLFNSLWQTLFSSSKTIIIWATNCFLIPVVLFYLLRDWSKLFKGLQALIPRRNEPVVSKLFRECNEVLSAFLRGQLLVMLGLGLIYSLGLTLIGLNTGFLIGILAGLFSIVPYLGFVVGIVMAVVAAIFQFHDILHIFLVLVVFTISQAIEGSLLTPNLVGDRIGLHPIAVIFAIMCGGQLFGFFGVLLALPCAAVSMVFIRYLKNHYISSRLYRA